MQTLGYILSTHGFTFASAHPVGLIALVDEKRNISTNKSLSEWRQQYVHNILCIALRVTVANSYDSSPEGNAARELLSTLFG